VRVLEDDRAGAQGRGRGDRGRRRDHRRQGQAAPDGPVEEAAASRFVPDPERDGASDVENEGGEVVVSGEDRDVPARAPCLPAHGDDLGPAADEDVVDDPGVATGTDEAPGRDVRPAPL
jgi:hypothetical protein